MLINVANPTPVNRPRKGAAKKGAKPKGGPMAKKHRSAAQRRATAKLVALNRARHHKNPSRPRKKYHAKKRYHQSNPSRVVSRARRASQSIAAGAKSFFGDMLNMQGALQLAGILAAPTYIDLVQEKFVPDVAGWKRLLVRAAIGGGTAFVVDRVTKGRYRRATLGFAFSTGAVVLAEAIKLWQVKKAAPAISDTMADQIASNPILFEQAMAGEYSTATLPTSPHPAMLGGYGATMYDNYGTVASASMGDTMAGAGGAQTYWGRGWNKDGGW